MSELTSLHLKYTTIVKKEGECVRERKGGNVKQRGGTKEGNREREKQRNSEKEKEREGDRYQLTDVREARGEFRFRDGEGVLLKISHELSKGRFSIVRKRGGGESQDVGKMIYNLYLSPSKSYVSGADGFDRDTTIACSFMKRRNKVSHLVTEP